MDHPVINCLSCVCVTQLRALHLVSLRSSRWRVSRLGQVSAGRNLVRQMERSQVLIITV